MNMLTLLLKSPSQLADTSIKAAGPEGNHVYSIYWLAEEDKMSPYHANTKNSKSP